MSDKPLRSDAPEDAVSRLRAALATVDPSSPAAVAYRSAIARIEAGGAGMSFGRCGSGASR